VAKRLYIDNLPYGATASDLENLFEEHGTVRSAQVCTDPDTGRSKGFGFVDMDNADEAQNAVDAVNGLEINGQVLRVDEARPRKPGHAGAVDIASDYFG
jgi:cold-inducible RNA-binding protein